MSSSVESGRPEPSDTDRTRCPLCGGANGCALALELPGTCWCFPSPVSREALERVPVEAQGVVCVCARCASGAAPRDSVRDLMR